MYNRSEFIAKAQEWIAAHKEEIITELQGFARIRSVSRADLAEPNAPFGPECRTMLDYALKRTEELGFTPVDHKGYCGEAQMGDENNAIGIIAHLDVVPEGDKWVYPPYGATRVEDDFLVGRGVGDNKGPAVMALYIMKMFKEMNYPLQHGVRLIFGCSEETGMEDMDYFSANCVMPKLTLVPDAAYPVNYAQKGSLSGCVSIPMGDDIVKFWGGEADNMVPPHCRAILKQDVEAVEAAFAAIGASDEDFIITAVDEGTQIQAVGKASHAASPENGRSAIYMLAGALKQSGLVFGDSLKAMISIEEMCSDYYGGKAGIAMEDEVTGKTTMVMGVAGTTADRRIFLHIDCRLSIATDQPKCIADYTAYSNSLGFTVDEISTTKPFYMPKDDPRVVALMSLYAEITGDTESQAYTMGGGTYSRCLENAITFGPGLPRAEKKRPQSIPEDHGGAHAPDEFTYIPNLLESMAIYATAIAELDRLSL